MPGRGGGQMEPTQTHQLSITDPSQTARPTPPAPRRPGIPRFWYRSFWASLARAPFARGERGVSSGALPQPDGAASRASPFRATKGARAQRAGYARGREGRTQPFPHVHAHTNHKKRKTLHHATIDPCHQGPQTTNPNNPNSITPTSTIPIRPRLPQTKKTTPDFPKNICELAENPYDTNRLCVLYFYRCHW